MFAKEFKCEHYFWYSVLQLSEYLRNYPLEACSVRQRSAVIAFLCNELNCSKMITMEIENHLDHMADIRRDKWVVEGKLRR